MRKAHAIKLVGMACAMVLAGCATATNPTDSQNSIAPQAKNRVTASDIPDLDPGPINWRLGGRWEYSDGYGLEVIKVEEGNLATLKRLDQPDDWMKRRGLFREGSKTGIVERKVIYRSRNPASLFPLQVGKAIEFKREFLTDKKLHVHQTLWKVLGKETIQVPAGQFDCWILLWKSQSLQSDWNGEEKWWYSPKVGNYVRMEFQYGDTPPLSRVLMKYQREQVK